MYGVYIYIFIYKTRFICVIFLFVLFNEFTMIEKVLDGFIFQFDKEIHYNVFFL